MTFEPSKTAEDIAALEAIRQRLSRGFEGIESWETLKQLDKDCTQAKLGTGADGTPLGKQLTEQLAASNNAFAAYVRIGEAIAFLKRVGETAAPPSPEETVATSAEVAPTNRRKRVKVKATTIAVPSAIPEGNKHPSTSLPEEASPSAMPSTLAAKLATSRTRQAPPTLPKAEQAKDVDRQSHKGTTKSAPAHSTPPPSTIPASPDASRNTSDALNYPFDLEEAKVEIVALSGRKTGLPAPDQVSTETRPDVGSPAGRVGLRFFSRSTKRGD